jgi:glycosyltransferase involved in cell wall biosynthesis
VDLQSLSISALLPVKNGEDYLTDLIPVIVDMLEKNDELIIVNDGSTDATSNITALFANNDERIRVLDTSGLGLVSALNLGFKNAKCPWVARFDVDDIYSSERLKIQRKLITESVAVIFSDYAIISNSGHNLGVVRSALNSSATVLSLVSGQRTPHPAALINRNIFLKAGGYLSSEYPAEDLGLWLRMSEFGDLISVPEVVLNYRLNPSSISRLNRPSQIEKKQNLISNWTGWNKVFGISIKELDDVINFYSTSTFGKQRTLLYFRDLILVSKIVGTPLKKSQLITRVSAATRFGLVRSALLISYWVFIRKIYRYFR